MTTYEMDASGLAGLLKLLTADGYTIVGPTVREGAIVVAPISELDDLPRGLIDEQSPGHYRLRAAPDVGFFGFTAPAQSYKPLFHPSEEKLYTLRRSKEDVSVEPALESPRKLALIGARACDLEGQERLDQVMLRGLAADVRYEERRRETLVLAVHCTRSAESCFCASMNTGPRARGFDLAFTEVVEGGRSRFVVEVGSERGEALISRVDTQEVEVELEHAAQRLVENAGSTQKRRVDPEAARASLAAHLEHQNWRAVAERCLACTNCTASCPTCFCSSFEERGSLDPDVSERWRRTDSCFNSDFSFLHGGAVREGIAARYRQWLTHKFSSWYEQFGTSGCVGCGRCITWCPVGIDVTEEIAKFPSVNRDVQKVEVDLVGGEGEQGAGAVGVGEPAHENQSGAPAGDHEGREEPSREPRNS